MARLDHPGKKSYFHLLSSGRKPSEYAIRSGRLDYYRGARFEVDAPLAAWFERHGAERDFPACDWERFEDPSAFTYASYVTRRRDDELFVGRLLEESEGRPSHGEPLSEAWSRCLSPLRFVYHGLQLSSAYVAHMAPASKISIAAMFQAADELRRVQRVAYRLVQLERTTGSKLAQAGREAWLSEPAWQGVRALIENLLASYDFGEALVALNAVIAPACDHVFLHGLSQHLERAGDIASARLLQALLSDTAWHRSWSRALFALVESSGHESATRLESLTQRWRPRAIEAFAPFATHFFNVGGRELSDLLAGVMHARSSNG
jgi:toluene monooxygenase system protein E